MYVYILYNVSRFFISSPSVKKMRASSAALLSFMVVFVACGLIGAVVGDANIQQQCEGEFQKVTTCLTFATGKAATPTKECCSSVTEIKNKDPACLCYIIQQIHTGESPQVKSLGIQEARLLQLPSACKLTNASVSDCPRLLQIPASSPDYAIFTNSSASTNPTTTTGTTTPALPDTNGYDQHGPQLAGPMVLAMTIFVLVWPAGFLSTCYP